MAPARPPRHPTWRRPFALRAELPGTPPLAAYLLRLMVDKQSNLCLAANVRSTAELLDLADECGDSIVLLKTHCDAIDDFGEATVRGLLAIAGRRRFLLYEDRKFGDAADIVKTQYAAGTHRIASWATLTSAHLFPGPGVIAALRDAAESALAVSASSISTEAHGRDDDDDDADDAALARVGLGRAGDGYFASVSGPEPRSSATRDAGPAGQHGRDERAADDSDDDSDDDGEHDDAAEEYDEQESAGSDSGASDAGDALSPKTPPRRRLADADDAHDADDADDTDDDDNDSDNDGTAKDDDNDHSDSADDDDGDDDGAAALPLAERHLSVVSIQTTISTSTEYISPGASGRGSFAGGAAIGQAALAVPARPPPARSLLLIAGPEGGAGAGAAATAATTAAEYTRACLVHARRNRDFVIGLVAGRALNAEPGDNFLAFVAADEGRAGGSPQAHDDAAEPLTAHDSTPEPLDDDERHARARLGPQGRALLQQIARAVGERGADVVIVGPPVVNGDAGDAGGGSTSTGSTGAGYIGPDAAAAAEACRLAAWRALAARWASSDEARPEAAALGGLGGLGIAGPAGS